MRYREKLKNSTVIKEGIMPKYYFGVMSSKKRKRSLIAFFLIALYTIATKFIFKTIDSFDFMYVVLIANLIFLFILKLISNSVFKLNHFNLYQVVFFLSRVCKLIIFISTFLTSTAYFSEFFRNYYMGIGEEIRDPVSFFNYDVTYIDKISEFDVKFFSGLVQGFAQNDFEPLNELVNEYKFIDEVFPYISRIISIVLFVPVFLYFLGANLKYVFKFIKWTIIMCIPIANIVYYLKWLFVTDDLFVSYRESADDKMIIKELRKLNPDTAKDFRAEIRGIRFLQSLGIALIYIIIIFVVVSVNKFFR